jgi:hypothetical protein
MIQTQVQGGSPRIGPAAGTQKTGQGWSFEVKLLGEYLSGTNGFRSRERSREDRAAWLGLGFPAHLGSWMPVLLLWGVTEEAFKGRAR